MPISRLTSNGRITVPKEIRDLLKLVPGDRIDFVVGRSGHVTLRPLNKDFRSIQGIVKSRRKHPATIEEMNEAIADGWAGI